jgi:hypothetical protein
MELKILFFACIPVGIFLLIKGIKMALKAFNTKIFAEIKLSETSKDFEITQSGSFEIQIKAPAFKKSHLDKLKPAIYNRDKNAYISLHRSIVRSHSNSLSGIATLKLFTFEAAAGNYKVEITEGSSLLPLEGGLQKFLPIKEANLSDCAFQIRESIPVLRLVAGILLTIAGGMISIGGLVLWINV